MLIDIHSHLDFEDFDKDREKVIKRAFESGVKKIINVGINLISSKKSIKLAKNYKNIFATVSLHPLEVEKEKFAEKVFLELAKEKKVVAIGETGFDFSKKVDKEKQKRVLEALIKIACKLEKPLILHCREAEKEILEILSKAKLPKKRGVIHCFGKDFEIAKKFLDLGFSISFAGNITYNPKRILAIPKIPLEKILVETDSPFMTPLPFQGKRNEPSFVRYVVQKIAEIKNKSFEEVAKITTKNARELFEINS